MWATLVGNAELVGAMLDAGGDPTLESMSGATAISIAEALERPDLSKLLETKRK
jgi:ankyrin repeat protein